MIGMKESSIQFNSCKMTLYLSLIISTIFGLILSEEISREDFLHDELEQKLELLKYDLKSIEKFLHTNLLYQNEPESENSTESDEYEYEDYEPEEEYNFEYEDYEYGEGSEDTESGDENEKTESTTEEVAPRPAEGSSRIGRLLRRGQNDQGKKIGVKKVKKGKKEKKVKKGKKEKKGKKSKKVKKQKGLSAGSGNNQQIGVSKQRKSTPLNLTPEQIRQICSSQSQWSSAGNLRSVSGGTTQNQFAEQFKQLTQSFNQLQAALQSVRKNSGSSSPTSGSSEERIIDNRGVNPDESQESAVGPLVQAAIGAQSAAANALRGLLPGGQVKSE